MNTRSRILCSARAGIGTNKAPSRRQFLPWAAPAAG
jgi:hypothetical protein